MQTTPGTLGVIAGPELEYFVLARLERFASQLADPRVRENPVLERLAMHATLLAVGDCLALGVGDEMVVILDDALRDVAQP
jgi:hypothetical protein